MKYRGPLCTHLSIYKIQTGVSCHDPVARKRAPTTADLPAGAETSDGRIAHGWDVGGPRLSTKTLADQAPPGGVQEIRSLRL